jgi:hypothetical protein
MLRLWCVRSVEVPACKSIRVAVVYIAIIYTPNLLATSGRIVAAIAGAFNEDLGD